MVTALALVMFSDISYKIREKLRESFSVDHTSTLPAQLLYRDSLDRFSSVTPSNTRELLAAVHRIESFFALAAEKDGSVDDKNLHLNQCHLLTEAVIAHNAFLFHNLLPLAIYVDDQLRLWNKFNPREPGKAWLPVILEKVKQKINKFFHYGISLFCFF